MLTEQVCVGRVGKLKRVMALDENDRSGMEDEGLVCSPPRTACLPSLVSGCSN